MLVIARKRHESVTIDGQIRVEVMRLSGGVARLRFMAPRHVAMMRGVVRPGDPAAVETVNGGINAAGMGIVELTLGIDQMITIQNNIHVGLVDLNATRALLFVDAPEGLSVKVDAAVRSRPHSAPPGGGEEAVQTLLPFSTPLDPLPDGDGPRALSKADWQAALGSLLAPPDGDGPRALSKGASESSPEDPAARTIPFPGAHGVGERD